MIKNFIKRVLSTIDSQFKTSLFARAITLGKAYYSSSFLNAIRRSISPTIVKWKYKIWIKDKNPLRLHLGCGDNHIESYEAVTLRGVELKFVCLQMSASVAVGTRLE